jgi:hypothetical protein
VAASGAPPAPTRGPMAQGGKMRVAPSRGSSKQRTQYVPCTSMAAWAALSMESRERATSPESFRDTIRAEKGGKGTTQWPGSGATEPAWADFTKARCEAVPRSGPAAEAGWWTGR